MDDKMDPNRNLQADSLDDALDAELRAIWRPAPVAAASLREKVLAATGSDPEKLLESARPIDLAARRAESSSRRLAGPQRDAPRRGMSRSVVAAMGAVVLLLGARIAMKQAHLPAQGGHASQSEPAAATRVDPSELTAEDEQFALGGTDDDDVDDAPSVLELVADEDP